MGSEMCIRDRGVVLFVTFIYVLVNLAVDILYGFVDPRIQLGNK